MAHKKGRHHTGKMSHHHIAPHPGKDGQASKEYHAANAKHGMALGMSHGSGDTDGSGVHGGKSKNGGEGMTQNVCDYD